MKFSPADWFISKFGKWLSKDRKPTHGYLSDYDKISYEVRPCDVLLVEGRNRISSIIKNITQSPWTHAALYIGRLHEIENEKLRAEIKKQYFGPPEDQLIIESMVGKGTYVTSMDKYNKDHVRICRPQGLTRADAQKVVGYAIGRLGSEYSLRHIFDLARLLFPWGIFPRRWRSSLFEANALKPTEDICSSMIAEAFASVKFPMLPKIREDKKKRIHLIRRNTNLFTPSDFDYSPYFSIIKYPLFSITGQMHYKDLPWKEGEISHDVDDVEKKKAD